MWFGEKMPPKVALSPFDEISILRVMYGMKREENYIVCWLYESYCNDDWIINVIRN